MTTTTIKTATLTALILGCAARTHAHFQELIPSSDIVSELAERTIRLDIIFTHPMENGPVMDMGRPPRFGCLKGGRMTDLRNKLKAREIDGATTYQAEVTLEGPGDHIYYIEPAPYWEPAEQKMIIHYTKVVVNGFADTVGWDAMVGFPVEIEPLTRPYGLWSGNTFRGIVKKNGKPVPFAEVEVEYRNADEAVTPPSDPFITQVIKADAHGVFAYTMPRAGWWAFAALLDGEPMEKEAGDKVDVELGALMWVRCVDMN